MFDTFVFPPAVLLNSQLSEDLGAAKKEIQVLHARIKELEVRQ